VIADPTKRRPGATARARSLRQQDIEPEYRLWGELRNRRLNGHKFARQIPIGPYIVDFVCREQALVLELDGGQHSESAGDEVRTAYLFANGYSVLRFWNHEVLRERRAVLDTILAALEGHLTPSSDLRFAQATFSPRGEEVANRARSAS
jgi:very-short-patch-repair endonuclease